MSMLKNTTGLRRNTIDKYYTCSEVVSMCMRIIHDTILIDKNDLIIEPSAGNGAFIESMQSITTNCEFLDLEPENDKIRKQDYLSYSVRDDIHYNKIHVIGNPPFGRQSSMAIKFIKKSCEFCSTISFILPKSFKKESLQKTFPLCFHLVHESDLPENSFLVNGEEHNVPCVFQIWIRKDFERQVTEKLEPNHYKFVGINDEPDIAFRRVGVNAGTIHSRNIEEKSIQSHYFIKFTNNKSVEENIETLSCINYDFNNTVGPKSISKQELISKFNPLLEIR